MTTRVLGASLGKLDALRGLTQLTPETEALVQRTRALLRGQGGRS